MHLTDIFDMVKPLLYSAIDGHDVCVIAYGASGNVNHTTSVLP